MALPQTVGQGTIYRMGLGFRQRANFYISGDGKANTSFTTPLLQSVAATALTITGNAASTWSTTAGDITLQAGSGTISLGSTTNLSNSGALTVTSGTTLALRSTTTNAISLDSGTTGAVNVGTGANSKTVTIGNGTGTTSVVINSGTGAINVGTNAVAHTITVGNTTGATSVVVNCGTGACSFGASATAHTTTLGSSTTTSATNINGGSGGINLGTTTNVAGTLNANATGKTAIQITDSGAQNSGITIGGDTNLYRSAADTLMTDDALIVAGATTLQSTVAITGNTTIGGTLGVTGATTLTGALTLNNTGYINTNSTTAFKVENSSGNTNTLVVDTTNGRAGINTASPATTFEVNKTNTGDLGGTIRISNNGAGGVGAQSALEFTSYSVGANDASGRILFTDTGSFSGSLAFQTRNTGAATNTLANRLVISSAGAVTISALNTAGVVHTNGAGLLSTSAIVNADLQAGTFSNITGTGALTIWLNWFGFGAISTGNNITTSANISTTGTGTVASAGTLNANATGKTAITIADSGAQNSGITIGGDTNLYRSAADTLQTDDTFTARNLTVTTVGTQVGLALDSFGSTSNWAATVKLSGDANRRFVLQAGGTILWGDGTNAQDTNLYRSAANILKTDDTFDALAYRVGGTAGASTTCSGGQYLQNQVTSGGIVTGGTCTSISAGGDAYLANNQTFTGQNTYSATSNAKSSAVHH